MALDNKIPTVNWPAESEEYKVVQLEVDGKPYLRFPQEYFEGVHSVILLAFLDRNEVSFEEVKDRDGFNAPARQGDRYKVHGMGSAKVNIEGHHVSFYGSSRGYSIGISPEHLDLIRKSEQDWTIEHLVSKPA